MKRYIPTRWSHVLGFSGVGALVRADNDLFVVMDISHWTDKNRKPAGEPLYYVDLLRGALGLDDKRLLQPPLARLINNGAVDGICVPAVRFPRWARCPSCGLLHYLPWRPQGQEHPSLEDPRCHCEKRSRLRQVDWVVAHPDGGLWDVPWHWLAHRGGQADCRESNEQRSLHLRRDGSSGHWTLHCDRCCSSGRFSPSQEFKNEQRAPLQPWQKHAGGQTVPSKQPARILEVNDPRLYFTRLQGGLVIPPESQVERGGVLDRLYRNHGMRMDIARSRTKLARGGLLRRLANEFGCTRGALEEALEQIEAGWPLHGETATKGQLLEKEHRALTTPIANQLEGEDFVTEHQTVAWQSLLLDQPDASRVRAVRDAMQQLVAVTRLREIRVFTGFHRVEQWFDDGIKPDSAHDADAPTARLVPPDLDGHLDWLPAIELYGEGIFFTLNEDLLRRWEGQEQLLHRAEMLQRRFERTGMRFPEDPPLPLTPRFILLHTLAHLLIRQLETEAGYPAASIRERIYCAGGHEPMAGILVYVAVTDIAGSLGGLAELAEPKRFLRLLASVFDHADWCSLDPVCAEHEGQGPSQLNRAACHACALVPEPSCQFGNMLLDRIFVAGDLGGEIQSLLAFAATD
ncbi:DUF1998 domain-containing protein [Thiorhodovibrio frisius]|uniref:MrfA-like Zn-binding domain-containing protein n=1 Tax=Thiorhodovibrio frisius TaxID=631362 RepID=H8YY50_9GAMM|nr:DUF1998 domain-containing protein [Thiorhodovibrio frisius]EIC23376.1 protein of unknown function (DUF1998) [Thiorhodovibrio frisius]WPL23543.1 hypothetical protein Thiofri_03733 [Thiorhodovibrio frisius]